MMKINAKAAGPALRFSPTAWAKLLYLRDFGRVAAFLFTRGRCVEDLQRPTSPW